MDPSSDSAAQAVADDTASHTETLFVFALRENWPWLLGLAALLVLLYLLTPILAPFVVGAALAYLGDPLVDRLQRAGLSRTGGVAVVFLVLTAVAVLALLLLIPLLYDQFIALMGRLPDALHWLKTEALPRLSLRLPPGLHLDAESLRQAIGDNWSKAGDVAASILGSVGHSTPAILAIIADLLMIPLVTFYLLRDWDDLVAWIAELVPRPLLGSVSQFARETDAVLSSLIRGQLAVMASLAVIYGGGLTLVGVNFGLLIGVISGLISFIPYLGFVSGLLTASIAMLVQTQSPVSLLWVGLVYGVGQVMESGVLTPMLVGDRIGLHPVAVIFAIMAGGQLFGFIGVLIALPTAAVIAVLMRHTRRRWLQSPVYRGRSLPATDAGRTPP
jgi:predicted PurR-regulated permease PerM